MAWKAKITAVQASGATVVLTYQVLNDANAVIEDGQQITVTKPNEATHSYVKGLLLARVKQVRMANEVETAWSSFVGQSINED